MTPERLFEKGQQVELADVPGTVVIADLRGFFRGHWHYVVDLLGEDDTPIATYLVAEYVLN